MGVEELARLQRFSLWLDGREGLDTAEQALMFTEHVALALRHGASKDLPLASMYRATQRQVPVLEDEKTAHARAFKLTNELLAGGKVVEINVVANRLALAHAPLMPAIYALRGGGRAGLSAMGRGVFDFIAANETASRGDVCREFGVLGQPRPDAVDVALTELQHDLLIDRGPSSVPTTGIFYLSKEGYPYRVLHQAHPEIAPAAARLNRTEAAVRLLESYLEAAVFAAPRKLRTVFQLLLDSEEIDLTLEALVGRGRAERVRLGTSEVVAFRPG